MRRRINGEKRERSSENEQENTESGVGGESHSHQSERCSSTGRGCLCHHDGSSLSVCRSPPTPLQNITDVHTETHRGVRDTYLGGEHVQW